MKFRVICNDQRYLDQVIEWYNKNYKTDFKVIDFVYDEVNFAEIEVTRFKPADIFDIGYQFGVKEQKLRQQGEIDW